MYRKWMLTVLIFGCISRVYAACEVNVDKIEPYYINGMFTDAADFYANKIAIEKFVAEGLQGSGFSTNVSGAYNKSEAGLSEVFEVLRQKSEDFVSESILLLLNNDFLGYVESLESESEIKALLEIINTVYAGTYAEEDTQIAKAGVVDILDTCSRVVLVTHSQGNFYGNAIFNDIYAQYVFPNGYGISSYPMLGMMQIASPVFRPGGTTSILYPEIVSHLTNDTDLVMRLVRSIVGSIDANYTSLVNNDDLSGHGLEASYLRPDGQGAEISLKMRSIAKSLIPYPLYRQVSSSSTALSGYGYSGINGFLDVKFINGSVYRYLSVSESTFNGLQSASSKGGYFNRNIRNSYDYERIK